MGYDGLNWYKMEECFLCSGAGIIETDQPDHYGSPSQPLCPMCQGTGELRIYVRKDNDNKNR